MIIAHLPAGYLLTKVMSSRFSPERSRSLWFWGLLASILPDADILWFHLVDHGVRHHREYITHWPLFWLLLFILSGLFFFFKKRELLIFPIVVGANIALHLLLDCLAAPVYYAAPFSAEKLHFVQVPNLYNYWVWNFLRHWTFQLELMIWAAAILVFGLSRWEESQD